MYRLIPASDRESWKNALALVGEVDATCLPDYHLAYSLRVPDSTALLWHFSLDDQHLVYPFLMSPVTLGGVATGHHDISSVYGYTGPLATTTDSGFLRHAWKAFDEYAVEQRVIAEFIRFSPFNRNEYLAHPEVLVLANRELAVSELPATVNEFHESLNPKTRNMLRRAARAGLHAQELELAAHLPEFRALYAQTMRRNGAPEFFHYDDAYWAHMLALTPNSMRLFGTFSGGKLVAASIGIAQGQSGLYHLGASLVEHAKLGASNLSLYAMSCAMLASGVTFLNMTGGRTVADNDPLLLFKKNNANGLATFHIGKRVIDAPAYNTLVEAWQHHHRMPPDLEKIIFWRN
jgi:Acetyltransferase (GNAT) domain